MNSNTHTMAVDSDGDSDEFFDTISIPDSDTDSGLLNGEDLKEDFSKALRADAPFTGNYFCCSTDKSAPNPALRVAGAGPLELPLSEGGLRLIASVASAEGHNANSVWEVEASDLAVRDAAWQDYLANTILPSVSDQLGLTQFTKSNIQIELSKLVLFGPGSDSFMHRTEETRGTNEFGKLAVFLPSPFEGGQVKISHTSTHEAFDINVASVSSNTTSVAWYNDDVVSETMPVTAGYQLVLIYHLVHTGSILTKPSLRYATDRSTTLGGVLGRWKKGDYEHLPSAPLLVLPLSKVYRPQSLKDGADILEDSDAEIIASLLPVAHDHGFSACLANVVPSARRTGQQGFTLFNLERITDGPDLGRPLSFGQLSVPNNVVVYYEGIEEADANRSVRTCLLVFQDENEMPIAMALQGAESTLRHLSKQGPLGPTATNRQLARAVLKSLGKAKEQGDDDQSMGLMHLSVVESLLECAVSWNDVELWKDTLPYAHRLPVPQVVLPLFRTAFSTFDVALIGDGVNNLIVRAPNLKDRLVLVEAILPLLPNDNPGLSWANGAVDAILSSYQDSRVEDVPTLIRLAAQHAALALILKIISNVSESAVPLSDACSFLLELAKEIHRNIDAFSSPPKSTAKRHPQTTASKVTRSSMKAAVAIFAKGFKSMEDVVQDRDEDKSCASRSAFNVDQICEIFELCLTVNDPVPCRILLETISEFLPEEGDIKSGSSTEDFFERTYLPLISRLNELLQSGGIDITEEPFQPFFKGAISAYLASVGSRQVPAARIAIGCRNLEYCLPCQALETFVNSDWTEYRFAMDLNRRRHLEQEIDIFLRVNEGTLPNGCLTFETLKHTSPHVLVVRKFSSLTQGPEEEKAKMVLEFLQSLSSDGTLAVAEKIMEELWDEVEEKYLEGMREDGEEDCQGGDPVPITPKPAKEDPFKAKGKEKMKADPERRRASTSVLVRRVKEEEDDGRSGARRKSSPSAFGRLRVKKEED